MIGGGAHRLLGTARGALKEGVFRNGGEIRLYDLNEHRAEVMAKMIMKSPEYKACPIKVTYKLTLDEALEGADLVSVTLLAGGVILADIESKVTGSYGYMSSDNISVSGAFLAMRTIKIVKNILDRMQVLCPNAILLDFANPVGVVAAFGNMYCKTRCFGICEGHTNHGWDLTRILYGENRYEPDWDLKVAGINHFAFITEGYLHGQSVFDLMDKRIAEGGWYEPLEKMANKRYADFMSNVIDLYKYRHALLFSSEDDGIIHILHTEKDTEKMERLKEFRNDFDADTLEKLRLAAIEARNGKSAKGDAEFEAYLEMDDDKIDWHPKEKINDLYVYSAGDVTVKVLKGLSGVSSEKVVLSDLNGGAVTNMLADYMAEFTHIADKDGIHRMEGLAVPTPVLGNVMELATYQTLVARACVTEDPRDLLTALCAYPLSSTLAEAKELWAKQLMVSEKFIPESFMRMPELY